MTKIIADSCCDLSPELISRFGIDIVPLDVLIGQSNFKDGITIHPPELFKMVSATGMLPKTAAPSLASFMEHYQVSEDVIVITIGSDLSATYQNALLASKNVDRDGITVIDSKNLSTGIGLLVLAAAEMNHQGLPANEIAQRIQELVPKVRSFFVVDTLDYLYKGGRCSAVELLVGGMLKIRPVIEVKEDGTLGVKRKVNGSRKKALISMVQDFADNLNKIDLHRVFITHTLMDEEEKDAWFLKEELTKIASIDEILVTHAGSTIASHCGPDTIGILYLQK
ncbi:MAG: DegV family protein [Anaerolineaceae bacterium]